MTLFFKKSTTCATCMISVLKCVEGFVFDGNCYLFIKIDSNKNGFLDKHDVQIFGKIFAISHKNGCQGW